MDLKIDAQRILAACAVIALLIGGVYYGCDALTDELNQNENHILRVEGRVASIDKELSELKGLVAASINDG